MKTLLTSAIPFLAALSLSLPCRADVIYSNLGPYDTDPDGPVVIGNAAAAVLGTPGAQNGTLLFQPDENSIASSFTVGVDFFAPGYGFSPIFDADLYVNVQTEGYNPTGPSYIINEPGAEIAEIAALQAPSTPGLVTFSPTVPVPLSVGSLYWAVLTPNNPLTLVVWDDNSLEVDGTLLTPEPATFGLLTCALAGLITIQRTRIAAKQR